MICDRFRQPGMGPGHPEHAFSTQQTEEPWSTIAILLEQILLEQHDDASTQE
jgi:hypothetical protein